MNLAANSSNVCPSATFTCSALNLPSVLRWFLDDSDDDIYSCTFNSDCQSPFEMVLNINGQAIAVDIRILEANQIDDDLDNNNFLSTMMVNVSALLSARISAVSCGSFVTRGIVRLNYMITG